MKHHFREITLNLHVPDQPLLMIEKSYGAIHVAGTE